MPEPSQAITHDQYAKWCAEYVRQVGLNHVQGIEMVGSWWKAVSDACISAKELERAGEIAARVYSHRPPTSASGHRSILFGAIDEIVQRARVAKSSAELLARQKPAGDTFGWRQQLEAMFPTAKGKWHWQREGTKRGK